MDLPVIHLGGEECVTGSCHLFQVRGEIICSHPTKALLAPMLKDAMRFGEFQDKAAERIGHSIEALSWGFEYNQVFELG
ncbi:MAG: hypothetical protein HZB87_08845, partial [Desulfatitalea sp.]|nr:hypothetical protein [Desulfatitalea sp.]